MQWQNTQQIRLVKKLLISVGCEMDDYQSNHPLVTVKLLELPINPRKNLVYGEPKKICGGHNCTSTLPELLKFSANLTHTGTLLPVMNKQKQNAWSAIYNIFAGQNNCIDKKSTLTNLRFLYLILNIIKTRQ